MDYANSVQNRLDRLPPKALPDVVTVRQMLFLIIRFMREQFERRSERIDAFMKRIDELEFEKHSAELNNSWHIDEIHRCMHMITCSIQGAEVPYEPRADDDDNLHEMLKNFL